MRSRVFDNRATSGSMVHKYWDDGRLLYDGSNIYTSSRLWSRMDDVVTPHFRKLSASGQIVQSPKAKEKVWFVQKPSIVEISCIHKYDNRPRRAVVGYIDRVGLTVPPILITDQSAWDAAFESFRQEVDLAITRAHANVDVSEMMLLATLGELPETARWLVNSVKRLKSATNAFTKRKEVASVLRTLTYSLQEATHPKGVSRAKRKLDLYKQLLESRAARKLPKDTVGSVASAWLEYRYAIRPLLGDIKNAIKAIQKQLEFAKRQTARGKELRVYDDIEISYDTTPPGARVLYEDVKIERKGFVKTSAGILFCIEDYISTAATILGLDQPVESAYELMPYSFILDWVVNLGEWLQSITKSSGLTVLSSWVTLTYRESTKVTPFKYFPRDPNYDDFPWKIDSYTGGGSSTDVSRVWRIPNPKIPLLPSFDLKVNLPKIIDLGFILRQMLSGKDIAVVKRS